MLLKSKPDNIKDGLSSSATSSKFPESQSKFGALLKAKHADNVQAHLPVLPSPTSPLKPKSTDFQIQNHSQPKLGTITAPTPQVELHSTPQTASNTMASLIKRRRSPSPSQLKSSVGGAAGLGQLLRGGTSSVPSAMHSYINNDQA